jgi:hypothetical protein
LTSPPALNSKAHKFFFSSFMVSVAALKLMDIFGIVNFSPSQWQYYWLVNDCRGLDFLHYSFQYSREIAVQFPARVTIRSGCSDDLGRWMKHMPIYTPSNVAR